VVVLFVFTSSFQITIIFMYCCVLVYVYVYTYLLCICLNIFCFLVKIKASYDLVLLYCLTDFPGYMQLLSAVIWTREMRDSPNRRSRGFEATFYKLHWSNLHFPINVKFLKRKCDAFKRLDQRVNCKQIHVCSVSEFRF
jgi:hypothetical protein